MIERAKRILVAIDVLVVLGFIVTCIVLTSTSSSSYLENLGVKTWINFVCAICMATLTGFATFQLSPNRTNAATGLIFFCNYYLAVIVCVVVERDRFNAHVLIILLSSIIFLLFLHAIALFLDIAPSPSTPTSSRSLTDPLLQTLHESCKEENEEKYEDDDEEALRHAKRESGDKDTNDYGTATLLELTKPHSNMLWISCAVLIVRLPLSLSIPHWVAETIGDLSQGNYHGANWNVFYLLVCGTGDAVRISLSLCVCVQKKTKNI